LISACKLKTISIGGRICCQLRDFRCRCSSRFHKRSKFNSKCSPTFRGVPRLDGARGKKRKQMYYIEESTCDIVETFFERCH